MLSNYTIKRMIPRLIIAVILVNLSYYICLIAVDISNIIGYNSYSALTSVSGDIQPNTGSDGKWEDIMASLLVGGLAAGAAGIALALTLSMPVVIMSLLALLMIAFILIARQALIILLIVLAPLAFVAYLLPNTENLYKKWQGMFIALLMVFPVVGLIFGASTLASTILVGSNSGGDPGVMDVMALAVLAIPLFAVPIVLKGALAVTGSLGAKLASVQGRTSGGLMARAKQTRDERKKYASDTVKSRAFSATGSEASGGVLGGSDSRRRRVFRRGVDATIGRVKKRDEKYKYAGIAKEATERGYFTDKVTNEETGDAYARQVASGDAEIATLIKGYAKQEVRKEDQKDIEAEESLIKNKGFDTLQSILRDNTKTTAQRAAAAAVIAKKGDGSQLIESLNYIDSIDTSTERGKKTSRLVQEQLLSNANAKLLGLSQTDKTALSNGEYSGNYDDKFNVRTEKKMSAEKLLELQPHDDMKLEKLLETENGLSDKAMQNLVNSIQEARSNPNLRGDINSDKQALHDKILAKAQERNITVATASTDTSNNTNNNAISTASTELKIEHTQSQPTQAPTVQPNPQTSRTSPPPNTSNFTRTASGLEVPRSAVEPNPPRDQS